MCLTEWDPKFFSENDLKTGFHQIRMKADDVEKRAFSTNHGQFEYLFMPMGALNSPVTFLTLMNQVFHYCMDEFVMVYIGYLVIFSNDKQSYYQQWDTVL